ncbi:MAG: pitrilysin family protein, partial [bacterium]
GSRYEPSNLAGASHLLEHMMFKGTKKRPSAEALSRVLDAYGADYNAYTGKDHTGYYVKIAGNQFQVGLDLVHDMVFNSEHRAAELAKEKPVVVEEIKMYEDNPRMHVGDLMEQALFSGTTLGRNIAGSQQSVLEMKRSGLLRFRNDYYVPERIVVVLSGKFSQEAERQAEKLFGSIYPSKLPPAGFEPVPGAAPEMLAVNLQNKTTEQIQLALGFRGLPYNHKKLPALRLLSVILGEGMSSRLFVAVRVKNGLAYSVGMQAASYEDTGVVDIEAGLDKSKLDRALLIIRKEIEGIKKQGPTSEELRRAKNHLAGRTLLAMEDCAVRAEWFGSQALFTPSEIQTPEQKLKKIQAVTKAEVQEIAREILDFKRLAVGIVGPFASPREVKKYFN